MKRDHVNYVLVGAFVLAMLSLAATGLFLVTGRTGPVDTYYVVYDHVTGLDRGTPVYFEGYQVGRVEAIEPRRTAQGMHYRVEISVREDWPVPADSVAQMTASGLLAQLSINIRQGEADALLEPGEVIAGQEGGDLFGVINTVAADMNELAQHSLRPLLNNLNTQVQRLAGELDTHAPAILGQTRGLLEKLDASAERLELLLGEPNTRKVQQVLDSSVVAAERASVAAAHAVEIGERGRLAAARLEAFSRDLDGTRVRVEALVAALQEVVADTRPELDASLEDLRRVLHVASSRAERIAYHMEGTSRNMHELSRQLRQNPGLLLGTSPPADEREPRQ